MCCTDKQEATESASLAWSICSMDWPTSEPMRPMSSCSSSATGCLRLVSDWLRMVCSSSACCRGGMAPCVACIRRHGREGCHAYSEIGTKRKNFAVHTMQQTSWGGSLSCVKWFWHQEEDHCTVYEATASKGGTLHCLQCIRHQEEECRCAYVASVIPERGA